MLVGCTMLRASAESFASNDKDPITSQATYLVTPDISLCTDILLK